MQLYVIICITYKTILCLHNKKYFALTYSCKNFDVEFLIKYLFNIV